MSLYTQSVPQMKKMVDNLGKWLEMAAEHAQKKSFDPNVYLTLRLAPDQYAFVRQVQAACDAAKFAAARVSGKEPPVHPDTEQTFDEIRARVKSCSDFLATVTEGDFAGAEKRMVPLPWMKGMGLSAEDYLNELAIPNFYFHATTAYAILRHAGVDLGKVAYIGSMNVKPM